MAQEDYSLYNKDKIDKINCNREIQVLSKLLYNIKEEENFNLSDIASLQEETSKINFSKSFALVTENQLYKRYSIIGLMKSFNLNVKYIVLDISILLDIWYNTCTLYNKNDILKCDLLILHNKFDTNQSDRKARALIELIEIRKTLGKITWLYIDDTNYKEFNEAYPGVINALGKFYRL